jgi:hypothetical protein
MIALQKECLQKLSSNEVASALEYFAELSPMPHTLVFQRALDHCFHEPLAFQKLDLPGFSSLLCGFADVYSLPTPTQFTKLVKQELVNRRFVFHERNSTKLIAAMAKLGICEEALVVHLCQMTK